MSRLSLLFSAALLLSPVLGCKGKEAPKPDTTATAKAPVAHPGSSAKPGSHEDWCEEHAVPESLCTRCNPQLTPAFKATGDWCEEHGLPESQCLKCNPNLKIVRPPKNPGG